MDDGTLGGPPGIVEKDFQKIMHLCDKLGLEPNLSKCEYISSGDETEVEKAVQSFLRLAPSVKILPLDELSLLGAPIHDNLISSAIKDKLYKFEIASAYPPYPLIMPFFY